MDKLHKDEVWLREQAKTKNSRTISSELGISYKLVELYLEKFNIPFTSMVPKVIEED